MEKGVVAMNDLPFIVVVEGNISSGKTTVLEQLAARGFTCYPENVAEWGDYLEEMYNGEVKTSDMLQMRVAVDQLKIMNEINGPFTGTRLPNGRAVVFVERWIDSSEHIFIKNALNSEHLTITPKGIKLWRDFIAWTGVRSLPVHAYVYIRTDPAVSYARILERSKRRRSERNIEYEYIASLHMLYERFAAHHITAPLLTLENKKEQSKSTFAEAACDMVIEHCTTLSNS